MGNYNAKVDDYVDKVQAFAKPVMVHIRELVHKACPEVEEKMKWSFPHFDYKGEMMCSMAAFKEHCAFTFWKASIMNDPEKILRHARGQGMGHFDKITSLKDLPSDKILTNYIREAMRLNDESIKVKKSKLLPGLQSLSVPDYFIAALNKNTRALNTFENFSPSNKREYIQWVTEAKTEETRAKRLETAIEWMAEGKIRNWKYLKK